MTKREAIDLTHQENRLMALGITRTDAEALRRISMTLRRWNERECGIDNGCIERDEATGKPFWLNSMTMRRTPIADKEAGALKRLMALMERYPHLRSYVQGDPRGCALYILVAKDIEGQDVNSVYTRGVAVA